jgi:hypothetical protein
MCAAESTGRGISARPRIILALSAALAIVAAFVLVDRTHWLLGFDAHAYWAIDLSAPYSRLAPQQDAFLYSPPAALLASTFDLLPWETFRELWRGLQVVALVAVAGPLAGPLALTPPVGDEFLSGNINLLFAAVIVAGFRWPALWAIPLLTKVTPGGIGLLWFAARGEWRHLGIALASTLAIVVVALPFAPELWLAWFKLLTTQPADPPLVPVIFSLLVRLAVAAALIVIGARFDRRWVVPFAVVYAHAHLWVGTLAILVALVPLVRHIPRPRPTKPALPRWVPIPVAIPARVAVPVRSWLAASGPATDIAGPGLARQDGAPSGAELEHRPQVVAHDLLDLGLRPLDPQRRIPGQALHDAKLAERLHGR